MAAIVEAAAVAEAVARDDGAGAVHERVRLAPAALVEIAGSSGIVPGVGHMPAAGVAADVPGLVTVGHEVGDQRLKARSQVACHRYPPGGCLHRNQAASMHGGALDLVMAVAAARPAAAGGADRRAMVRALGPAGMMVLGVLIMIMMMPVMMCGLSRYGNGQKSDGR